MHTFPSNEYYPTVIQVPYYTTHAQCMLHPHISREGTWNDVKVLRPTRLCKAELMYVAVMSQSEQIFANLQQPNESQELESFQSTTSSNGGGAEQQGNGESGSGYSAGVLKGAKTYNYRQCMEVALLSIAIVVVLMLLLLPTIFYHLPLTLVSIFICLLVHTSSHRSNCCYAAILRGKMDGFLMGFYTC